MKITKAIASDIIDLIKSGKIVYISGDGDVYSFTYHGDDNIIGLLQRNGRGWRYAINSLLAVGFWGYELVNAEGDPVDLSYYQMSDANTLNKHPHYDLIVKWAADPANVKIQWLNNSNIWVDVAEPAWLSKCEYRIKLTPVIYRQAIYASTHGKGLHTLTLERYSTEEEFAQDRPDHKFIGWYDATAEERFE